MAAHTLAKRQAKEQQCKDDLSPVFATSPFTKSLCWDHFVQRKLYGNKLNCSFYFIQTLFVLKATQSL